MRDRLDVLTCAEAIAKLDDYVDRELSELELHRVRAHLETCAACATRFHTEEQLLGQVRDKVRRIAVPAGLMERIQQQLAKDH